MNFLIGFLLQLNCFDFSANTFHSCSFIALQSLIIIPPLVKHKPPLFPANRTHFRFLNRLQVLLDIVLHHLIVGREEILIFPQIPKLFGKIRLDQYQRTSSPCYDSVEDLQLTNETVVVTYSYFDEVELFCPSLWITIKVFQNFPLS